MSIYAVFDVNLGEVSEFKAAFADPAMAEFYALDLQAESDERFEKYWKDYPERLAWGNRHRMTVEKVNVA